MATVQAALSRVSTLYRSGNWPAGVSAVIVVSGRITAGGSLGSSGAMVDVSGAGNYPHVILKGDPVTGGILDANRGNNNGNGWVLYIRNNKVTLGQKLTLTGGRNLWGGAVCVGMHGSVSDGEFILDGGEISGNTGGSGGAVMVYKGSMSMISGLIKNNYNDFNNNIGGGGAIYVFTDTTLYLSGGTIEENGSGPKTGKGGGLFIEGGGTVYMTGGDILNNVSDEQGGGVYVAPKGMFNMSAGTISGNTSGIDGGVGVAGYGAVFNHTGGTVSGNTP